MLTATNGCKEEVILDNNTKDSITYSLSDLGGDWVRHSLVTSSSGSSFWIHGTITNNNNSSVAHLIMPGSTMDTTFTGVGASISLGVITTTADPAANTYLSADKKLMVGTTKRGDSYTLVFDQKVISGTSYSTADMQGTWQTHYLVGGGSWSGWVHSVSVVDNTGTCTLNTTVKSDGSSGPTSGGAVSVSADGVVTVIGNTSYNGFLSADKKLMVSSMTDGGGGGGLSISQKTVAGTTYSIADLKGAWQLHDILVGSENWTEHGTMTIDAGGNGTISNMIKDSGGSNNDPGIIAFSVSSEGVVTFGTDFHGFISADKKLVIGTKGDDSGHAYSLVVLQKKP